MARLFADAYAATLPGGKARLILFVQTFGDLVNFNPHVHVAGTARALFEWLLELSAQTCPGCAELSADAGSATPTAALDAGLSTARAA